MCRVPLGLATKGRDDKVSSQFEQTSIYIYIYLVDKVPQDITSTVLNIYVHMHKLDKKDKLKNNS